MTLKICPACKERKPLTEFPFKSKIRETRQSRCRSCIKIYKDKHYRTNKNAYVVKAARWNKEYKQRIREFLFAYLEAHPCVDCGENDYRVLDFDHVRGTKVKDISRMIANKYAQTMIEAEIAKCEVRCANCHRRKTARDFDWYSGFEAQKR